MDISPEKRRSYSVNFSTMGNIKALGPEKALTGPVSRGDSSTISSHIDIMRKLTPELLPLYRSLGLYTVDLALKKGTLDKEGEEKIKKLLGGLK